MKQFRKVKVVLLNTQNDDFKLQLSGFNILSKDNGGQRKHLYFISDDKIKEGDKVLDGLGNIGIFEGYEEQPEWVLVKYKKGLCSEDLKNIKKIIATTDTSLSQTKADDARPMIFIPQLPQQFIKYYIEEYNKGNIITDVLVEYEPQSYSNRFEDGKSIGDSETWGKRLSLKVNTKDNTITIKQIKDSWNREELILLLNEMYDIGYNNCAFHETNKGKEINPDKWIEENL